MRTEDEIESYQAESGRMMERSLAKLGTRGNPEVEDAEIAAHTLRVRLFEACVPQDFWNFTDEDVHFNREQYDRMIRPYMSKLATALKGGYGFMLLGDNGVGKTMFLSMVLRRVCMRGFSAWYTTLPQLDHDIKRSFNDQDIAGRLEWYMTSDFVAIDEMGKERFKQGDTFMKMEVERILKQRYDNGRPTLIATNADLDELEELYGKTVMSILNGKYQHIVMDPGDYREEMKRKMDSELSLG